MDAINQTTLLGEIYKFLEISHLIIEMLTRALTVFNATGWGFRHHKFQLLAVGHSFVDIDLTINKS
jgi:hypothetical protein